MTDKELYTLFEDNDDPSDGMAAYKALFQAGYRAGLKKALNDFCERCDTKNIAITDVAIGHISWLEAGLKGQP